MTEAASVRVTVEFLLEQDRIAGTVHEPDGRESHFAGWIGLISALERSRAAGTEATGSAGPRDR
jgi:hypothetical protein